MSVRSISIIGPSWRALRPTSRTYWPYHQFDRDVRVFEAELGNVSFNCHALGGVEGCRGSMMRDGASRYEKNKNGYR